MLFASTAYGKLQFASPIISGERLPIKTYKGNLYPPTLLRSIHRHLKNLARLYPPSPYPTTPHSERLRFMEKLVARLVKPETPPQQGCMDPWARRPFFALQVKLIVLSCREPFKNREFLWPPFYLSLNLAFRIRPSTASSSTNFPRWLTNRKSCKCHYEIIQPAFLECPCRPSPPRTMPLAWLGKSHMQSCSHGYTYFRTVR